MMNSSPAMNRCTSKHTHKIQYARTELSRDAPATSTHERSFRRHVDDQGEHARRHRLKDAGRPQQPQVPEISVQPL